jgi:hypothetical protein
MSVGRPHGHSRLLEEKNFLPIPEIGSLFLCCPVRVLTTLQTTLSGAEAIRLKLSKM